MQGDTAESHTRNRAITAASLPHMPAPAADQYRKTPERVAVGVPDVQGNREGLWPGGPFEHLLHPARKKDLPRKPYESQLPEARKGF